MTVAYRPSNSKTLEEFKTYVELMLKEYADEINARRTLELATISQEPNPTVNSGMFINNPDGFDPLGDGQRSVIINIDGTWKRLDNEASGSLSLNDLTDVIIDTPTNGDMLVHNGSQFVNQGAVGVPSGSIHAFGTSVEVNGYLVCDGRTLLRADYPALFGVIGSNFGNTNETDFNLPSLQGQFLRSYSTNNSVDPDGPRNVGSTQADAFQGHEHNISSFPRNGGFISGGADANSWGASSVNTNSVVNKSGYGTVRIATETRLKNVAVCYQIKT